MIINYTIFEWFLYISWHCFITPFIYLTIKSNKNKWKTFSFMLIFITNISLGWQPNSKSIIIIFHTPTCIWTCISAKFSKPTITYDVVLRQSFDTNIKIQQYVSRRLVMTGRNYQLMPFIFLFEATGCLFALKTNTIRIPLTKRPIVFSPFQMPIKPHCKSNLMYVGIVACGH